MNTQGQCSPKGTSAMTMAAIGIGGVALLAALGVGVAALAKKSKSPEQASDEEVDALLAAAGIGQDDEDIFPLSSDPFAVANRRRRRRR